MYTQDSIKSHKEYIVECRQRYLKLCRYRNRFAILCALCQTKRVDARLVVRHHPNPQPNRAENQSLLQMKARTTMLKQRWCTYCVRIIYIDALFRKQLLTSVFFSFRPALSGANSHHRSVSSIAWVHRIWVGTSYYIVLFCGRSLRRGHTSWYCFSLPINLLHLHLTLPHLHLILSPHPHPSAPPPRPLTSSSPLDISTSSSRLLHLHLIPSGLCQFIVSKWTSLMRRSSVWCCSRWQTRGAKRCSWWWDSIPMIKATLFSRQRRLRWSNDAKNEFKTNRCSEQIGVLYSSHLDAKVSPFTPHLGTQRRRPTRSGRENRIWGPGVIGSIERDDDNWLFPAKTYT